MRIVFKKEPNSIICWLAVPSTINFVNVTAHIMTNRPWPQVFLSYVNIANTHFPLKNKKSTYSIYVQLHLWPQKYTLNRAQHSRINIWSFKFGEHQQEPNYASFWLKPLLVSFEARPSELQKNEACIIHPLIWISFQLQETHSFGFLLSYLIDGFSNSPWFLKRG